MPKSEFSPHQRKSFALLPSLHWESFLYPISREVRFDEQNPQLRKSHLVERPKRGPDIRTPHHGAAAAIDHDLLAQRGVLGPLLQVLESLRGCGGAVIHGPRNMRALVERLESYANDEWFLALRIRKLFCQIGRLQDLGARPGLRELLTKHRAQGG